MLFPHGFAFEIPQSWKFQIKSKLQVRRKCTSNVVSRNANQAEPTLAFTFPEARSHQKSKTEVPVSRKSGVTFNVSDNVGIFKKI